MKRGRSSALVELRGVRVTLGGRAVLRGVDWTVRRGEGWLVTGPNGAGKTTLLRVLAGRVWPDANSRGGTRTYYFDDVPSASPIGLEGRLAWISPETHQRFARLEPSPRAGEVVLTGFANTFLLTHRPKPAQRAGALRFAENLGLAKLWRRPFAELSQGQQRLVLLARALVAKPVLLVLDEFSDGLDDAVREKIGEAITQRLRAGAAVMVASHRAEDALPGLARHLFLEKGRAKTLPLAASRSAGLPPKTAPTNSPPGRTVPGPPQAGLTLRLQNASVSSGDHARIKRILHKINWSVAPGEHWAVRGANGSGKSTLLRAIYGELPVARGGLLERFGQDARSLPLPEARRRMGWVSPALQHHYAADVSVLEVAASGFQSAIGLQRKPSRAELVQARATLRQLGGLRLARRRWGEISFGEARLALLARALAPNPRLLLLDEPCDGLSPVARKKFLREVDRAAQAGAQVIVAAHRAEDLPACLNRTLRLRDGRLGA